MKKSHGPFQTGRKTPFGGYPAGAEEEVEIGDNIISNRYAKNIGQYNQYMNSKKANQLKKKSKSMRNMRATVGAIQGNYTKDLDLQPLMSTMGGRDTRKSLGFMPNNLGLDQSVQPPPPPKQQVPGNKAQFQTNLSQFDLAKSQSANGKAQNPAIYKSAKNQPYMDKIVKRVYHTENKARRMSVPNGGAGGGSSFITNHKVDYKDFGTYVEDCKKHLMMSRDLKIAQEQQKIMPAATFNLKEEKGKLHNEI